MTKVKRSINLLDKPLWFPVHSQLTEYHSNGFNILNFYGLPTEKDIEVLHLLLSKAQRYKTNIVDFKSIRSLAKELKYPLQGYSYKRIKESLEKWKGTSFSYKGFYTSKGRVDIPNTKIVLSYDLQCITFNKPFLDINDSKFSIHIPVEQYQTLSPTAKRLYEIISHKFYNDEGVRFRPETLMEKFGVVYKRKNNFLLKLKKAVQEIEQNFPGREYKLYTKDGVIVIETTKHNCTEFSTKIGDRVS